MSQLLKYLKKHHLVIITIVVTIAVVPWGVILQRHLNDSDVTTKYYYTPSNTVTDSNELAIADCWRHALSSNRGDAYRCSNDNHIYDPCFTTSNFDKDIVACPYKPTDSAQIFKFSSELDNESVIEMSDEENTLVPWFVILRNGSECNFLTGATDVIADKRVDYGCDDSRVYLQLPIEQSDEMLTIRCFDPDLQTIEFCPIKEAWF